MRFEAGPPETVVSLAERERAGLDHWVDGTFGIVRHGSTVLAIAPNGRRLARHRLDQGGFVAGLIDNDQDIVGLPAEVDHASGGPLLRDPATGALVLVYHGEIFHDGNHGTFTSFLAMAVSTDDGETFHDLGPIIRTAEWARPEDPYVEIGGGGFALVDGWMHVYFLDRTHHGLRVELGVARCRVEDVVRCALAGEAPEFTKYHDGDWTEPGLGGKATSLVDEDPNRVLWCDIARIERPGEPPVTLLAFATVEKVGEDDWAFVAVLRTSTDGLEWGEPTVLGPGRQGELLYVTIDSGEADQRVITGDSFDLYRVRAGRGYRWDDAELERMTVRITPS